jgi:hypothetical protein
MATKAKAGPGKAQKKGRSSGGRTTAAGSSSVRSDRYTPPIPKNAKTSPKWMGILIIALFLLGVLIVILNYAGLPVAHRRHRFHLRGADPGHPLPLSCRP